MTDEMQHMRVDISGGGVVELVDAMRTDPAAKIVQAARVSHDGDTRQHTAEQDARLRARLIAEAHATPFRHSPITLHVKAPEFIARQWYKHVIGGAYSFNDSPWNEISQRYTAVHDFYVPSAVHTQATKNKQAAADIHPASHALTSHIRRAITESVQAYYGLLDAGVAREEARIVLPLAMYTRWYWTASQQALKHFVRLRASSDAQGLMREYAAAVDTICAVHYGDAWSAEL